MMEVKAAKTSGSAILSRKQGRFSWSFLTQRSVKLSWERQWARSCHWRSVLWEREGGER